MDSYATARLEFFEMSDELELGDSVHRSWLVRRSSRHHAKKIQAKKCYRQHPYCLVRTCFKLYMIKILP